MNTQHCIGLFTTDAGLVISSWDPWLAECSGISSTFACGKPLVEVIVDLESRGLLPRFKEVLSSGTVQVLSPAFHHYLVPCPPAQPSKCFSRMQQRVTLAPLTINQEIVGVLVTVEDVTARLERERQLAEQLRSQDEATRLRAAEKLAQEEAVEPEQTFMSALNDPSWRVRRAAVQGMARSGGSAAVAALLRALRHEHNNLSVLNSALQVLAMMNLDTVTPLLLFLQDPDPELRIYAALALGETGDASAAQALIAAIADPEANVSFHAIEALGKIRAEEAVGPLCDVAESGDFFLAFPALDALRHIGDQAAAPRIQNLLGNPMLRDVAVEALGDLGSEEAVEPLAELLNDPAGPHRLVARVLANIYDRYEKQFGEGAHLADLAYRSIRATGAANLAALLKDPNVQEAEGDLRAIALVLGWLKGSGVEVVLTRLLGHPSARREVVEALVRHGSLVTDLLLEQTRAEDIDTRKAAVIALGRIGDVNAVEALIKALKRDEDLIVLAAGALAKIGDRSAFEALLELLSHPDATIRQSVVAALNSLGHPAMPERMIALLTSKDPLIRESAVKIAGYFGYRQCLDQLLQCCLDSEESVRCVAIEHVAFLDDERVIFTLAGALADTSPRVRAAAVRALAHLEHEQAVPLLCRGLGDPDSWVRYFSARSLGKFDRLGSGKAFAERGSGAGADAGTSGGNIIDILNRLAVMDKAAQVRIAAMETLGRVGGMWAVPILTQLTEDLNPDISRAAMGALGLIDHPDALRPLLSALHSQDPLRRQNAIKAFGKRGGSDAALALQWLASSEGDDRVVQTAIEALAHMESGAAVNSLIALTEKSRHRESCIKALSCLGEAAVDWVAGGLAHGLAEVRRATVQALARMKLPRATSRLLAALGDVDGAVRLEAINALALLGSRQGSAQLAELAALDPDPEVRNAARKMLR